MTRRFRRPAARFAQFAPFAYSTIRALAVPLALVALLPLAAVSLVAQDPPLTGRAAVEALAFAPLHFDPPETETREVSGATVFFLRDATLPLVDVFVRFEGGYARFGRENYAVGSALPALLRTGGTLDHPPDSVDARMESLALQTSFGGAGGAISASMNTLQATLDDALELWWSMIARPRFDTAAIAVWRGRQLEAVLRRTDAPGPLAISTFNRIMYGDHPIGWELAPNDLAVDALTPERFRRIHRRIVCRDNLVLGVAGDVSWDAIAPRLTTMIEMLPPCAEPVPAAPLPEIRREPGIFVMPRALDQSTIIVAEATSLTQDASPEYFASRIGNSILGASGFSSRLLSHLRTEEGYAYSAASLWTTPRRYDGLLGATTRTRPATTVAALRLILELFDEMRTGPPTEAEVHDAVEDFVNGFVFAFGASTQIVSRRMAYEAAGLPADWLNRYVEGIQQVRPDDVRAVFARYLDPARMTILVVGDVEAFDEPLESLGIPLTVIRPDSAGAASPGKHGSRPAPSGPATSEPSGSRRFRR